MKSQENQFKIFKSSETTAPDYNDFDLTHDIKLTGKIGDLIPCCVMETLPGDKFNIGADTFVRFQPLISPVMHRMDVTVHYFYVPNRILWDGWEDFLTNKPTAGALPKINIDASLSPDQERFLDYMGIPPFSQFPTSFAQEINALPLAAYQKIYNEYYRAQFIEPEINVQLAPGLNTNPQLTVLRKRCYEHDYFTSALPDPQLNGTGVEIPLGAVQLKQGATTIPQLVDPNTQLPMSTGDVRATTVAGGTDLTVNSGGVDLPAQLDPNGTLEVGSTLISTLRRAFRVQEWLEKAQRVGNRYIETLLGFFGVNSSDGRLQRPEYITGTKNPVIISEVLNTTGETLPQGNMSGHAVSVGQGNINDFYCEEHGYIIGIMSVMPKTNYAQGLQKTFLRETVFDYYWPQFAHIGEQPVLNKELFAYQANGDTEFGYIPRYSEYKYMQSRIAGEFRTNLDYWTLFRKFANTPTLNTQFLTVDQDDVNRIFAVTDQDDPLMVQILNKVVARRKLALFGEPRI